MGKGWETNDPEGKGKKAEGKKGKDYREERRKDECFHVFFTN